MSTVPSSAGLIAAHRRYNDQVLNEGHLALVDELVHPNHVNHVPPGPDLRGPEALREFIAAFRRAFPDVHFAVEDLVVEGDRIAVRWIARATHRGEFMGIPATGRPVQVSGISIHRFVGAWMQESWDSVDNLGLLQQLGTAAPPGPA